MRDGRIGYPALQFDGDRLHPGIREVVDAMSPVVATMWTVASWLTSPQPDLDDRVPMDRLRAGRVEAVVAAARRTARALEA